MGQEHFKYPLWGPEDRAAWEGASIKTLAPSSGSKAVSTSLSFSFPTKAGDTPGKPLPDILLYKPIWKEAKWLRIPAIRRLRPENCMSKGSMDNLGRLSLDIKS